MGQYVRPSISQAEGTYTLQSSGNLYAPANAHPHIPPAYPTQTLGQAPGSQIQHHQAGSRPPTSAQKRPAGPSAVENSGLEVSGAVTPTQQPSQGTFSYHPIQIALLTVAKANDPAASIETEMKYRQSVMKQLFTTLVKNWCEEQMAPSSHLIRVCREYCPYVQSLNFSRLPSGR